MTHDPTSSAPRGWNTWDFHGINRHLLIEDERFALEVRVLFLDELTGELLDDFSWGDLRAVGPHAANGSYTRCELQVGFEAGFCVETAAAGQRFWIDLRPTRTSGKRPVIEIRRPGGGPHRRERVNGSDRIEIGPWIATALGVDTERTVFVALDHPYVVGEPGGRLRVAVAPRDESADPGADEISAAIAAAAGNYHRAGAHGLGALAGSVEPMLRAMHWNTVFDPSGRGICTPVSRHWSRSWGGVVLFGWDTFLGALMAAIESPSLALANVRAALAGVTDEGFVPNWRLSSGAATLDRSQPPVGGLSVYQAAMSAPDPAPFADLIPALARWHSWWPEARDGNRDGLLEWGSAPDRPWVYPQLRQVLYGEQICCCYESGMDNSPIFDGVPYDRASGTLRQADVGLNALHVADGRAIAALAERTGRADAGTERIAAEARARAEAIDRDLWSDAAGLWLNRRWDGSFSDRIAPTSLYPLLAGCGDPDRRQHALHAATDPALLGGPWPMPSIARNDPAWPDNDYWRGRVWPPLNFLVLEGMRVGCCSEVADQIAERGLEMFRRGWGEGDRVYENYSSATGDGGDVANSDPLYTWGGLLVLAALRRVIAPSANGGLDLGHLGDLDAGVTGMAWRGRRLTAESGAGGVSVTDADGALLEADVPVRVHGFDPDTETPAFSIRGPAGGRLRFHGGRPGAEAEITVNSEPRTVVVGADGAGELVL